MASSTQTRCYLVIFLKQRGEIFGYNHYRIMRKHLSLLCSLGLVLMIVSCAKEKVVEHPYAGLSSEYYDSFSDKALTADAQEIRDNILTIVKADRDSLKADRYTRAHYKYFSTSPSAFLWIDRKGVSTQADTLLACLDSCDREGFEKRQFGVEYIRKDLETLRNLSFETEGKNSINRVLARLEYNLTKAFLRYAVGQRYGFTNPFDLLNRLDVRDSDSVRITYRQLFDDSIHICGKQTFYGAINAIKHDSVGIYLAKAIDGVYDSDPAKNPDAKRYDTISIDEVIEQNLQVVDMTASILARDNHMPMRVFALQEENSIVKASTGDFNGTTVTTN